MGLFSKLFGKSTNPNHKYNPKASYYKMDTLEEIASIPVPSEKFEYNCDFTESIEYVLQRKATQFKKDGKMELAIACLRKSNEIMPFAPITYTEDDYGRLEKYLKLAGKFDEARETNAKQCEVNEDRKTAHYSRLLELSTMSDMIEVPRQPNVCAECARYHGRIYSKKKSKFPQMILFINYCNTKPCDCPTLSFYPFWEKTSIPTICSKAKLVEYSNRPFEDDRTHAEKKSYDERIAQLKADIKDRNDYDWLCEHMSDKAPKSYGGYRNMKNKNSDNYKKLVALAKKNGYII